MNPEFEILLCTNGLDDCLPGMTYGIRLAGLLRRRVTLLGALGSQPDADVRSQMAVASRQMDTEGIAYRSLEMNCDLVEAIETQAALGPYWSVYSTPSRPLLQRLLRKSTFQRLMAETETPIIRLRAERWPIRHILACSGGLQSTQALEEIVNSLALAGPSRITWLHVVEPDTDPYHPQEREEDFAEASTPHAQALRQALQHAHAAGLEADVRLRQGVAVHEILAEIETGNYDLVGMGSSYSFTAGLTALRHTYVPNITAQIAEDVDLPILCVRAAEEDNKSISE